VVLRQTKLIWLGYVNNLMALQADMALTISINT